MRLSIACLATVACLASACSAPPSPPPVASAPEAAPAPQPAPVAVAPQGRAIPPRFHGRYAASIERCGTAGDESELEIRHDHVAFHESSGPVLRASDTDDVLEVRLHLTGEGETREADYRFRLESGGDALVDAGSGFRRVRCR